MSTDAEGRQWAARLSRVESRNVTFLDRPPPFWTDAKGSAVRDADGNVYQDFSGAFGVAFAGHRHPAVLERIASQSEQLVHGMGDIHPPAVKVEFLEALAEHMPWPESRAILGLSGSDAVEAALKTAQLATGRIGVIAFEGSYHGLTLGALATTHREHFRRPFNDRLVDHVHYLPFPSSPAQAAIVLDQVTDLLSPRAAMPVGAAIVEPVQGRAGVRIPPDGFVAELGARMRDGGGLLIADEIFTGMGRTGTILACEHDGAVPDLICVGKALGGGMPLSACCGAWAVMDAWPASTGEAIHTSTFLGHPLSCAGGLGFLAALETDRLVERAKRLGDWALSYLSQELADHRAVREVRGRGLMLGIELEEGQGAAPAAKIAEEVLQRGLIVLPAGETAGVVELTPPATISRGDLERGLKILVETIRSAC